MKCHNCNAIITEKVDGKDCGGVPTVRYHRCGVCGWTRAITRRDRKVKFVHKPKKSKES